MNKRRVELKWEWCSADNTWKASVAASDSRGDGFYHIHAVARPYYCDRGKWHVIIEEENVFVLDKQEGFPRYYFDLENLKDEMELWANERQAVKTAFYKQKAHA